MEIDIRLIQQQIISIQPPNPAYAVRSVYTCDLKFIGNVEIKIRGVQLGM